MNRNRCPISPGIRIQTAQPLTEPIFDGEPALSASMTSDGRRMVIVSKRGVRIVEAPLVALPIPSWLPDLAEAIGAQKVTPQKIVEPVLPIELLRLKSWFTTGVATNEFWDRWARWFFADRSARPISCDSPVSTEEYVERLLQEEALEKVRMALLLSPANAAAMARLARLQLRDDSADGAENAVEVDWLTRRALELALDEPEVWWTKAAILSKQGKMAEALEAMHRVRDSKNPQFWLAKGLLAGSIDRFDEASVALTKAVECASARSLLYEDTWVEALRNRSNVLRKLGRAHEAQADLNLCLDANHIPRRDPNARVNLVDLSAHYHRPLATQRLLRSLPRGVQTIAGVEFDLRALVEVTCMNGKDRPREVAGMSVDRHCQRFHFLHAMDSDPVEQGTEVGHYLIHYADSRPLRISIVFGRDLANLRCEQDVPAILGSEGEAANSGRGPDQKPESVLPAWESDFPRDPKPPWQIRLFKMSWENPRPDVAVSSIDFVATLESAFLVLVAITAE